MPNLLGRLFAPVAGTRAFSELAARGLPPLDRATGGRATRLAGFPLVWLTTTGRRSSLPRRVALLHVRDGDRLVVAGSHWGRPRPPAWALNLDADPEAVADGQPVRARRATPEEAARWWPLLDAVWPAYPAYRRRAGREIPLYALEPRPGGDATAARP